MNELIECRRRRAILVALSITPLYRLRVADLRELLESVGYAISLDRLRTDIAWLAEQGCIELGSQETVMAKERGIDAALGRSELPGIARPTPTEVGSLSSALTTAGVNLAKALNGF